MSSITWITNRIEPDFSAAQATSEDTPEVGRLLVSAAEWLQAKGSTQWSSLLRGDDYHDTPGAIARGDVFVFRQSEVLAGMVILLQRPSEWDRQLWGEEGHKGAVYLHRLAINRQFGGTGLGTKIMGWAESGVRFPGKDRIRLDCIADNPVLNDFYRGLGYEWKGSATGGFNLYEKRLAIDTEYGV